LQGLSWAEPQAFTRLLTSPTMLENHLMGQYLAGLRGWVAAAEAATGGGGDSV